MRPSVMIAGLTATLLVPPPVSRVPNGIVAYEEGSRKARRAEWFRDNNPHLSEPPLVLHGPRFLAVPGDGPHPLSTLLEAAELQDETIGQGTPPMEGQRVLAQMVGTSPLGLNMELVPGGDEALIYADEANYLPDDGAETPVMLGDVVSAYVVKVRSDQKLDLSFRPPGALPKLEVGAAAVLRAAHANGGTLELGDASSPMEIRTELGMSKATFKAARGHLLRQQLVVYPLADHETVLTLEAASALAMEDNEEDRAVPASDGRSATRAGRSLSLLRLPSAAGRRNTGPAALLELLGRYGEVKSLRGLVRHDQFTGRVTAHMATAEQASAAVDGLKAYEVRGGGGPITRFGVVLHEPVATSSADGDVRAHDRREGTATGGMRSVFVGNLPYDATEDDLWDVFLDCGYIESVWLSTHPDGQARGFGRVHFADAAAAADAVMLRGTNLRGNALRIEPSTRPAAAGRDDAYASTDRRGARPVSGPRTPRSERGAGGMDTPMRRARYSETSYDRPRGIARDGRTNQQGREPRGNQWLNTRTHRR